MFDEEHPVVRSSFFLYEFQPALGIALADKRVVSQMGIRNHVLISALAGQGVYSSWRLIGSMPTRISSGSDLTDCVPHACSSPECSLGRKSGAGRDPRTPLR